MRGILFTELERYVSARAGADTFDDILARLGTRLATVEPYVSPGDYPDDDLALLVAESARELGVAEAEAWREFGRWSFAPLATRYRMLGGHPDLLAFLAALDRGLRTEVPRVYTRASLDAISIRTTGGYVQVTYRAPIPDCAFVAGLFEGASETFHLPLRVDERACRKRGARACRWEGRP